MGERALVLGRRIDTLPRVARSRIAHGGIARPFVARRADIDVSSYPYPRVHLVRGALLSDAGQTDAASIFLKEAARCARDHHECGQIDGRLSQLGVTASSDEARRDDLRRRSLGGAGMYADCIRATSEP